MNRFNRHSYSHLLQYILCKQGRCVHCLVSHAAMQQLPIRSAYSNTFKIGWACAGARIPQLDGLVDRAVAAHTAEITVTSRLQTVHTCARTGYPICLFIVGNFAVKKKSKMHRHAGHTHTHTHTRQSNVGLWPLNARVLQITLSYVCD